MADTAVAITAGTGTNIDTRTEATNGNHRQVIVIGDPATNAGVAPVDVTTGLVVNISPGVDKGSGTGGSLTQRVIVDSSQLSSVLTAQGAFAAGAQQVSLPSDHPAIVVGGNVAHDAADSGNGVKQAFKATSSLSALTPVSATADRTDAFAGMDGVQIVRPDTNLEDISTAVIACTSGANTSALAAAGASIKWYVKGVMIFNNGASNGSLLLTDGSGGTTKAKVPFPASTGTVVTFPLPVGFTANTAVFADPSGSDTIDVTIFGFKSKV